MPVRTARLASADQAAGGQSTVYTCPAGKTAIVKDVRVSSPVGTVTRVVVGAVSGPRITSLIDTPLGTGIAGLACFVVLEPGDSLILNSAGSTSRCHISGSELDGVAP